MISQDSCGKFATLESAVVVQSLTQTDTNKHADADGRITIDSALVTESAQLTISLQLDVRDLKIHKKLSRLYFIGISSMPNPIT